MGSIRLCMYILCISLPSSIIYHLSMYLFVIYLFPSHLPFIYSSIIYQSMIYWSIHHLFLHNLPIIYSLYFIYLPISMYLCIYNLFIHLSSIYNPPMYLSSSTSLSVICFHLSIIPSVRKTHSVTRCYMDEHWGYSEWNKPVTRRQVLC